ncbi:MAG: LysR family transcriptional regulator [Oscillospiraceae bacterium]|jgi:DNA-binding transcriptional LysR family regulator|nr:LysR family transcriptional regulator [Oscillospiraceae bacterium]
MNELKVKCFLTLAEVLSFSKAADALFVSQPVVSRNISAMETELGLKLFLRDSKSVRLTPAGEALYAGVKELSAQYTRVLSDAKSAQDGVSGSLKIGALAGQSVRDFLPLLKSFEERFPGIQIHLEAKNLRELRKHLCGCTLDIVFGARTDFDYFPELTHEVVAKADICVVVPRSHRLFGTGEAKLRLADFREDIFITLSEIENSSPAKRFDKICEEAGIFPNRLAAPDLGTLMLWLECERGITILDDTHVFSTNKDMRFIHFSELGFTELSVVCCIGNTNPCVESFMAHVVRHKSKLHLR